MITNIFRDLRKHQKGFTLIELMTVLVILGVLLGIGLPRYIQVQAKAEWESDVSTIRNFAKAAETYAASMSDFSNISIGKLDTAGLIDGNIILNRVSDGTINHISLNNKGEENEKNVKDAHESVEFEFDSATGRVNNLGETIQKMIGNPPYGKGPIFEQDSDTNSVDWS